MREKKINVMKVQCSYCGYCWIRTLDYPPKGCPKCYRRFVGKKPIILERLKM